MSDMFHVVEQDGQPDESAWPYLDLLPTPIEMWQPPSDCGQLFKRSFLQEAGSVERINELLDANVSVILVMAISESFYHPLDTGIISADAEENAVNTHAVVAVGYGNESKKNLILIRNSWGVSWGLDGYAWLDVAYLGSRLISIGTAGAEV